MTDLHLPTSEAANYAYWGLEPDNEADFPGGDEGLSQHVREHGVLEPIHVSTDGRNAVLVDGHHRVKAALENGVSHIPVTVNEYPWSTNESVGIGPELKKWFSQNRRQGHNFHNGLPKSGAWLLEASRHVADGDGGSFLPSLTGNMPSPGMHTGATVLRKVDPTEIGEVGGKGSGMGMHSGTPKSGAWLLEASRHVAYDIQSPPPGEPLQTKRGPTKPSPDMANDPMGHLNERPYDYNTMVNNLVSHHNGANDDERKQGRLWYKAAHDLFHNFAKDNNITPERAVAYGSAFSPLTDWGDNVHHAQKFMLGYRPGDPDFSPHDWQTAHIDPKARAAFQAQNGRDPSHSDEDLHALADLHSDSFKRGPSLNATNDLSNPDARANWMQNIQHHGIDKVLADHEQQALATYKKPGHPEYSPAHSMRASGIKTLGGNIQKAKDLYHSPEDVAQMFKVLGGPKISHFTDNILDDTPINSEGYYEHPNGDWAQNKDLGGTIDSHHIRAASMPHGGWERKAYASKNPNTDHEYDVFNRGLLDATKHINSQEPDPTKHITPKQLQATVWLKHKNDKDYFERQRNPQTGQLINHESELGGAARPADWQFAEKSYKSKGKGLGKGPSKAAALEPQDFQGMPPLWRKLFMSRQPQEWTDLLHDYVEHHSPSYQTEDPSFHQAAIQKDWYTSAPMAPRKPRRPNAPRYGPTRPKKASWYVTADDHDDPMVQGAMGPQKREDEHQTDTITGSRWFVADTDVDGKNDDQNSAPNGPVGTPAGYNDSATDPHAPSYDSMFPPPHVTPAPIGGGGGGGSYGGGGSAPAASGGGGASGGSSPVGGPPSKDLAEALARAGIDPSMHPLISGFSQTEGNNPSGVPTLGFTDSQAGSSLDQHAQALSKQIHDRQSVAGPFPHGGTSQDQAAWMANVVGQSGVKSDWQGNAQPARSDYINRVVKAMPPPSAPTAPTAPIAPKAPTAPTLGH